jgi:uncharacterized membrane protein YsdA (DUF1294 family)
VFERLIAQPWIAWSVWLALINLATFLAYALDKAAATKGKGRGGASRARRVPESTLHGLALLGGVVGGWIGRHALRHKTRKPIFAVVLGLATIVHAGVLWTMAKG